MTPDINYTAARSAVTGRFVPMWIARRNPGTTVIETIRYVRRMKTPPAAAEGGEEVRRA